MRAARQKLPVRGPDRVAIARLLRKARSEAGGELHVDIHLVYPDCAAWHLKISDAQLTTYAVIDLEPSRRTFEFALVKHMARKLALAEAN